MKTSYLIKRIHYYYIGDTNYPSPDSDEYASYLATANDHLRNLAEDPLLQQDELWEERELGTISSSNTVDLDDDIARPSDSIEITSTDGDTRECVVMRPKDRKTGALRSVQNIVAYLSGFDPKTLTFVSVPTRFAGAKVTAGVYLYPPEMTGENSIVPTKNTQYLILRTAADLALVDSTRMDFFDDLNGMANDEYQKAISKSEQLPTGAPNTVPTYNASGLGGGL